VVPVVTAWLQNFTSDSLRYPLLCIRGESATGKTEYAKSLFLHPLELKVGASSVFPAAMRGFERGRHDAVILDDVRDLAFVTENQEKLQGKYDHLVEFATTQGGALSFSKYLFRIPVIVTVNWSTRNMQFFTEHDWLRRPENCVLLDWVKPA
jgi:hypothetical protein